MNSSLPRFSSNFNLIQSRMNLNENLEGNRIRVANLRDELHLAMFGQAQVHPISLNFAQEFVSIMFMYFPCTLGGMLE